jgi:hypothetical protein
MLHAKDAGELAAAPAEYAVLADGVILFAYFAPTEFTAAKRERRGACCVINELMWLQTALWVLGNLL